MRISRALAFMALFIVFFAAWPATAAIDFLETTGFIEQWVLYGSDHGPCSLMRWTHEPEEGIGFDFETTSAGEETCTDSEWSLACLPDGLYYSGSHLREEPRNQDFHVSVEARVEVLLNVTEPALLTAQRQVEGILGAAGHTVSVETPDGTTLELLGADPLINSGEFLLEAGVHRVILAVNAYEVVPAPFSYAGSVEVHWPGTVNARQQAWDQVKSLYR